MGCFNLLVRIHLNAWQVAQKYQKILENDKITEKNDFFVKISENLFSKKIK